MKYNLILFFLLSGLIGVAQNQHENPSENVVITTKAGKTQVHQTKTGNYL